MLDNLEGSKLKDLKAINLLDTSTKKEFDDICNLTAFICDTPISLSFIVTDIQTPLHQSFCVHAIKVPQEIFIVEDARKDVRFKNNSLVTGAPSIVFYAGMPLINKTGSVLGTLCVTDTKPQKLEQKQIDALLSLSNQVVNMFELHNNRVKIKEMAKNHAVESDRLENIIKATQVGTWEWNLATDMVTINEQWASMLGYTVDELQPINSKSIHKMVFPEDIPSVNKMNAACFEKKADFYVGDFRFLHKKGHAVWIHDRGQVISWSKDGQPLLMVGTHTDITKEKENELVIEQSEKRFKGLVQNGSDLIVIIDLEGNYQYASPTSIKILDIPPEDFIGKNAFEFIHPEDKKFIQEGLLRLKNEKQFTFRPYRFKHGDGSWRWIETIVTNLIDNPVVGGLVANSRDVTERVLTEEKLKKSEDYYRLLYDSQTNYVVRTNMDGNYTYVNKKFVEEFGWLYPDEEILGKNCLSSIVDYHHQKTHDVVGHCIAEPGKVFKIELDKPGSDGKMVTTLWDFVCTVDKEGVPTEIQCIGLDITARVKSQKALEESEQRYSDIFHLSPQPMWVYDIITLEFLDVNRAAIKHYGYSYDEFMDMDLRDIRPESEIPKLEAPSNHSQQKGESYYHGEFIHKKKNGKEIVVEIRTNILSYKGKVVKVALATDITERYKHTQAIEKQNKKLKKIAWTQSHRVRAPLTSIMGLIDLLNAKDQTADEKEQVLKYIMDSAKELDEVISKIVSTTQQDKI
ncbi:PAS domain S-box protein [Zobellia barbeyronii]|uniref:histidine kinase n=1 Tax=Zobellia barbeyronii TaxID=2748009 RepID=A0ABS5WBP9_9FLAO|nr:PAS domain S-box protein [Zobellia barbeyronii]MBT2160817.1 PAS domain S-box protein [Zobellia barbeyronii]